MTDQATIEQIAKTSPALVRQSTEQGKFAYPIRFNGQVPLKVKMIHTVTSDLPMIFPDSADMICVAGNEYYVWVNSYGAVSAILDGERKLGLKPNEFEVTEYHPINK